MNSALNIIVPIAGKSAFFEANNHGFPKPLIEIRGKTMVELVINNLNEIPGKKKFIFILKSEDCVKYHVDNTVKLLTDNNCEIIYVNGETQGAACTSLLAIEHINNDAPLVIANSDQIIDDLLPDAYRSFVGESFDAAVITFESVHPQWSYIRLDKNNAIIQTAEKNPISKNAIAGLYYFKYGKYYVDAAFKSIEKNAHINGSYYIAPVLNELILSNKKLGVFKLDGAKYHSFYSPQKIQDYENQRL